MWIHAHGLMMGHDQLIIEMPADLFS